MTRLRRHRGLWVLAVVVLLIKLATSSLCLTDGMYQGGAYSNLVASAGSSLSIDAPVEQAAADENGSCVLGEAGGCHCACAHTMPLPAATALSVARMQTRVDSLAIHSAFEPATTGSLLRPPIA